MRQVFVEGELHDGPLRLAEPAPAPRPGAACPPEPRLLPAPGLPRPVRWTPAAAMTFRISRVEADWASVMAFRVMPTIQAGSRAICAD